MSYRPGRRTQRVGKRRPAIATATDDHIHAGRALKYRAARASDRAERAALFAQAAERYLAAVRADGRASTYALINAASLYAMANDPGRASGMAGEVLALLDGGDHAPDTPYWLAATRAEAELVQGEMDAARASLAQAVALAPRAWEDHAIALRQFRLLLGETGRPRAWLDAFTPPPILAYGGVMALAPGDRAARERIEQAVAEIAPCEAYGALAAGTDILVAEALLARDAELNLVLPVEVERFRAASVTAVSPDWGPRFDACLERAASVHVAPPGTAMDAVASGLAAQIAKGLAIGRASDLETTATGLRAVAPEGGEPEIAKAWHAWSATGNPTATIELERSVDFAGFAPGDATTVQIVLAAASSPPGIARFGRMSDALTAARGQSEKPLGLDVQAGEPAQDDVAAAAAAAAGAPGLWASADALALARLAEPTLDAELAGSVGHARGTSDLYRIYLP